VEASSPVEAAKEALRAQSGESTANVFVIEGKEYDLDKLIGSPNTSRIRGF
jgi:hypothetical protein